KMETNRKSLLQDWPVWILLALDLAASLYAYPHLHARAFFTFFVSLGVYLLLLVMPAIDPRRANYNRFSGTYRFMKLVIVLFLVALHWLTLAYALGWPVSIEQVIMTVVSGLLLILGNVMGRIKQSWVGFITPWTLADEGVWNRTHRLGGRVRVVAGLVGLVGAIMGGTGGKVLFLVAVIAAFAIPFVYSYFDFRRNSH
ncbi:MAG TPA: SdpI family protein, partial [Spirochaetia bacterium]|nr:SdpI family protein [Spirochaetia bacterium]